MNERCSAVLLNKLPLKEKDPGSFTIPCDIGNLHIDNALADLGASISLMPYSMYEKLGLGEPKPTRMSLELADRKAVLRKGTSRIMSATDNAMDGICGDINSPINNMHELKIRDEFLKILRYNAFNGMDGGDVIDHIARVVKITEWIKVPDIDKNRLRIHVFSKSLSNDAEKWWNDEIKGTTIRTIGDLHDKPRDKHSNMTCLDSFYKPYLDTHDGIDTHEIINEECSPILVPARHDICDQDELCKTEEFTVIRYSIGLDEFVAVEPSKISTVKRTPGSMLAKVRIAQTSSNSHAGPCCKIDSKI
ncbi:hypothetical protein Tco_1500166 [Tanacetum coccineum]